MGFSDYPPGYRDDEEMYVYDQCCDNCHNPNCPMEFPESEEDHLYLYGTLSDFDKRESKRKYKEIVKRRKEDAIIRDEQPTWCVYWQGSRRGW